MASPLTKKYKWPSEKKKSNFEASDFVPYVSNIANMFRKVPRPMAPDLVDPIVNQKVSLAGAKAQTEEMSRAADLATQGLDAQTGAAVRTGNLANRLRSLNDLSSREAMINAQTSNQANAINANIDAQNARITNDYRDDLVNAQLTQTRLGAENLANASDKYIAQDAARDQMELDREKTAIASRQYNPGMYNRLSASLAKDGVDIAKAPEPFVSSFAKYRNTSIPKLTTPAAAVTTPMTQATGPLMSNAQQLQSFPELLKKKPSPKYLMQKYAAGGMMSAMGEDADPTKPIHAENSIKLYKTPDTILIKDRRTTSPTTGKPLTSRKTVTAKSDDLEAIIAHAKTKGVDPLDALSIAYQESEFNRKGIGFGEVNSYFPDQDVSDSFLDLKERTRNEQANMMAKGLKDKFKYANDLGFGDKGDAYKFQAYNGYGKLSNKNGEKAFYGIPVSRNNPLDMSKNPAYGKTVVSLRDKVLRNDKNIQSLINETPAYVPYSNFSTGGRMKRKYATGGKLTKPFA